MTAKTILTLLMIASCEPLADGRGRDHAARCVSSPKDINDSLTPFLIADDFFRRGLDCWCALLQRQCQQSRRDAAMFTSCLLRFSCETTRLLRLEIAPAMTSEKLSANEGGLFVFVNTHRVHEVDTFLAREI